MLVMEDRRKEVKAILCEELDNLRQRIIENHIRAGQRASGKTIKSLHVVVDDNHGTLYGRQASSGGGTCLGESTERIL